MLKAVVIGLAVLIVLALAALVAGIVVKGGRLAGGDGRGGWVTPLMAQVPPDAEVESMALDGDRLVVHVKRPDGSGELLVFDLRRKNLSGRIRLEPGTGR